MRRETAQGLILLLEVARGEAGKSLAPHDRDLRGGMKGMCAFATFATRVDRSVVRRRCLIYTQIV